ncbi:MAG: putative exporter/SAM-dependent methyltransferase [Desulforhopalus sp.]|jgi:predicted exporter/SAM-dependent methyltransferase
MINYRLLAAVSLLVFVLAAMGLLRLDIDTDVARSLPSGEKVVADGLDIFEHHPVHDQIAVDIMLASEDPDTLVEIGSLLEKKLLDSGLFAQVGTEAIGELIPQLAFHAARNLPMLFSKDELEQNIAPLLDEELIHKRLQKLYQDLSSMDGIGQAGFIDLDPLGLKDLVLAKMAPLAPSLNSRFYQGRLLSADSLHLLVVARPLATGTDTASARSISELISVNSRELTEKYASLGHEVTLTPVGAYRAALDNETIIRHDVQLALVLATVGIGLLLLFAFPRPLLGLLSLVPALAGTGTALFVYSLFHPSISIMVLGFGGAIISITVDHGIAYLLFLDRNHQTKGKEAAREVYAIGVMAVVTSIGAFLILSSSGFLIFAELGQFTALGILFSFLFVHTAFPRIFPVMPAGSSRALPLRGLVNSLYNTGKPGAWAAALLAITLLFFAKPQFEVSLSSMNTVSEATLAADELFTKVWGNIGERVFLMNSAGGMAGLQMDNDQLLEKIELDIKNEVLSAAFVPSMIFPGRERGAQNFAAWHEFWVHHRGKQLKEDLRGAGLDLGFTPEAFTDFFSLLDSEITLQAQPIPAKYFSLLGISEKENQTGLIQFVTVQPGENYDGAGFFSRYGQDDKIFDASFFTKTLADILFSTFTTMLLIIAASVVLLTFFFYLNLQLTLLTLLPPFFAYICTLGTLKLIGRPLDIPALMLSVVILGMGVDYSIFCVRAHQRYRDVNHPSYVLVRVAVFMAGCSTLIGFGVLAVAEHSLLRSIGVTSLLGIGYSLLGTFLLLPPLLNNYVARENNKIGRLSIKNSTLRIRDRFRTLEPYPRLFARFKIQYDPMFRDLPRMLGGAENITTIIDIGCGYGVPACWCLEQYSDAEVYGIDPDPERVRVAALAVGDRGIVTVGWAPEIPAVSRPADVVLLLDMLHYLDDETVSAVFKRSFQVLGDNGLLVTRFVLQPTDRPSWSWHLENSRIKLSGLPVWYRSAETVAGFIKEAGFEITVNEVSSVNPELVWMVSRAAKGTASAGED